MRLPCSLKGKRKYAGWDDAFMAALIAGRSRALPLGQRLSGAQPNHGSPGFRDRTEPHHRTRMPRDKRDPAARDPSPHERAGSEAINAMVARTAPAVLELLGDGVPRSKPAILEALAGRHARDDVTHTLIRLAVTGQVVETGGKYVLGVASGP
jgi:hypothetical protein